MRSMPQWSSPSFVWRFRSSARRAALLARRRALEAGTLPVSLDIYMMIMDVESSNNQVTIMSSEKAYFEVQVDAFGRESEVKTKEVAKITNEVRAAVQGSDRVGVRREGQALAGLGRAGVQD